MKEIFEHLDDLPAGVMKDEILKLVRTEGVVAAVRAAIDVLGDSKATAAARATMAALMFRLAGYLDKPNEPDDPFGLANLSGAQLREATEKLQADADKLDRESAARARLIAQLAEPVDIFA